MWLWALVCTICAVYLYCEWRRRAEDTDNEPPMVPGAWPILGHILHFAGDNSYLWTYIQRVAKECHEAGGVATLIIGPRIAYVITDPDDFFTVANTCLEKDVIFYDFVKPWVGDGLATSSVQIWKHHRKLLNPAFSQVVLDGFIEVFNQQARRLVDDLAAEVGKGPFDHTQYLQLNALETICLTSLGVDYSDRMLLNSQYVQNLQLMLNLVVERAQKFWLISPVLFRWSELKKRQDRCIKALHNMSKTVLRMRKAEFNGSVMKERQTGKSVGVKFKPFLDLILELQREQGVFTDRQIREHVDTVIMAGHDTSATTLMYTLLLLGSYPEVQKRVYKELREVLGETDRDVEKQDLSRLVYLEAVIKESMRIYPFGPILSRQLNTNVELRNCKLAAGRSCILMVYGLHRHPMWGPDANKFRPERWLDPAQLPPNAFVGFSLGRRNCIGKSYAMMSMKTTLAHVLRRYVVRGDHTQLRLKYEIKLTPIEGHHISIETRMH